MKKILSSLLAFAMMLAVFSGMVIFTASADEVQMHIPFINQYTLEQAQKMGKNNGWGGNNNYSNASNYSITKDDNGRTVISLTTASGLSDQWKTNTGYLSTGTNATPFVKDTLIDGINIFGDAELSNKTKIAIKFDGDDNFKSAFAGCNLMLNSGTERVCLSLQSPTKSNGYLIYDFSKITRNNYDESGIALPSVAGNFDDAYDGRVSTLNMAIVFNKTDMPVTFWIDDVYLVGAADTVDLHRAIREAKAAEITGEVLANAEAVYRNTSSTQDQINAARDALDVALDAISSGYAQLKSDLNDLLNVADGLGLFDDSYTYIADLTEADFAYSNPDTTGEELRRYINVVRKLIAAETAEADLAAAFAHCIDAWSYNYPPASFAGIADAVDQAWAIYETDAAGALALLTAAYNALVPLPTGSTTADFFDGWTTAAVNDVVDANSDKLCDSIGRGLNVNGEWNGGDFSNNTTFEANSNFSLTANVSFANKAMGWKNMDRSGTLAAGKNYAYPVFDAAGLSQADGIRFKLESTGYVQRILIGLSNCATTTREQYAMKIRPEYVAADGYINIPFSYFEAAFWCNPFAQSELDNTIVLIVECFGAAKDTKVTLSDLRGYKELEKATAEQLAAAAAAAEALAAFDVDGRYAELVAAAEALDENSFGLDCDTACNNINAILSAYEGVDRAALKAALIAGKGLASYDAALATYYNSAATQADVNAAAALLADEAAVAALANAWEYNYTAESWTAFRAAADAATTAAEAEAALALLVPLNIKPVTGSFFEGWTTDAVNAVVTANSDKLCDSIGEGLNINQAWNNGDFSNNTTFTAGDGWFSMKATADFTGKAMGWKNMDRSQTLQPDNNGAYPAINVAGLSNAEGIRFKLEANKPVERILIGLSNCSKFVREQYALKIKPEYTLADGYINIPFSYFEKAFWCSAFAQSELEDVIVFIVECYGLEEGTTVTISDVRGYKTLVVPTEADFETLAALVATLKEYDLDGTHFADAYALAESVAEAEERAEVLAAIDELQGIVDDFCAPIRKSIKAKLEELVELDVTNYFADEIVSFKERYYGELSNNSAVALLQEITACIDQFVTPDAPAAPEAVTVEPTRVVLAAIEGAEYKCGDGEWQLSNEFTGLTPNTAYTFYARYYAQGVSSASASSEGTAVTTAKEAIAGSVVVNGDFRYGTQATAEVELTLDGEHDYVVEWYADDALVATGAAYTFAANDIGATFFVKVSSADLDGALTSDAFGPVGKALVNVANDPTADLLPLGMSLAEAVLSGGETDVEGVWAFVNPEIIPDYEQSGSEFDVTFTPADADLYEVYSCKVAVVINAVTEEKTVVNTEFGTVELSGSFHNLDVASFTMENITPVKTAYFDLLRAANRSGSGKNIIFTYAISFDTAIAPYIGTLTFKANLSADRAGETYTVWFFTKDGVVGKECVVNEDGSITIEGLKF
ncbi:MAG: hypothetical protein IJU94_01465 [Clostridia bacterium]|nr:hypothetical protein [Clostridia bacterium]